MTTDAYIFDIDGTLADNSHRVHYVREKPKNWPAYRRLTALDKPIIPVIRLMQELQKGDNDDLRILIVSGRGNDERDVTEKWLNVNGIFSSRLYMRPERDSRADYIIKEEIYKQILADGYNVLAVFDDRKQVKRMWVEKGVFVFDVNQHDAEY